MMGDIQRLCLPRGARAVVVDSVYSDPDRVRCLALRARTWDEPGAGRFAGRESCGNYYNQQLVTRLEDIVGSRIDIDDKRLAFGKFRLSQETDRIPTRVHIDHSAWAAIIYLTPDEYVTGGLGIYGSVDPELDGVPDAAMLRELGYASLFDFDSRFVTPRSNTAEAWRLMDVIAGRYNRMVVFEGSRVFHGVSDFYGRTAEQGRLTQNFFFELAPGEAESAASHAVGS